MITIKCGQLFVEKFNEENGTNFTPKEIFSMLAEKAFKGNRHMVNWTNSKFFQYLKDYNKFLDGKKEEPSFEEALNSFCYDLENRNCGIETSINVYGGCAESNKYEMQTTEFNYCDNLHFSIDERYCSFIGSFFQILVNGFSTTIDDKDIIWLMYESFNKYYDFIHGNEDVKDKQLPTWNGCYLYEKIKKRKNFTTTIKFNGDKFETIDFIELLDIIATIKDKNINVLVFESFGQTNTSSGYITIDLDDVCGWFGIFEKVLTNIDEDFDIRKYANVFGKKNLLFIAMENGEVSKEMLNPIFDFKKRIYLDEFKDKNGIKFLLEYIKLIMNTKEIEMSKNLANFLTESSKSNGKKTVSVKVEIENIFKSSNHQKLMENLMKFCDKASAPKDSKEISDVVEYFINDDNRTKFKEFLIFTQYNI